MSKSKTTKRMATLLASLSLLAAAAPMAAQAKHGADDPPGDNRGVDSALVR